MSAFSSQNRGPLNKLPKSPPLSRLAFHYLCCALDLQHVNSYSTVLVSTVFLTSSKRPSQGICKGHFLPPVRFSKSKAVKLSAVRPPVPGVVNAAHKFLYGGQPVRETARPQSFVLLHVFLEGVRYCLCWMDGISYAEDLLREITVREQKTEKIFNVMQSETSKR